MTSDVNETDVMKAYIIATCPRSGSFYLSELLWNTGVCGQPSEYVRAEDVRIWKTIYGCKTYDEYLAFYLTRAWSHNRVFGAKLMWEQFVRFAKDLLSTTGSLADDEIADSVNYAFDGCKYIFLRRKDKLRQAISLYRAVAEDKWHKTNADAAELGETIDLNTDKIDELIVGLVTQETRWQTYLDTVGATYMTVYYEDLQSEPKQTVARIFDFLGIIGTTPLELGPGQLVKQADQLTEMWVRAYLTSRAPTAHQKLGLFANQ